MDPKAQQLTKEYEQELQPQRFNTEHAIKFHEFEWSLVQHHASGSKPTPPVCTWSYNSNSTGVANAEKRLFGRRIYKFYIRNFHGLLGLHQVSEDNFKILQTKDFVQYKPVLESYYNPHIYSLQGQRLLWYMALPS
jgi:hypothetical protein